MTDMLTEKPNS